MTELPPIPERTVILTFDDAVRSHLTMVAPRLRAAGFNATFFVTQAWMADTAHFLTWEEIAELHRQGFEIGNHTWTHCLCNTADSAMRLPDELSLVDSALARVGVPRPVSFAWPGCGFSPETVAVLRAAGYQYSRRGLPPEKPGGARQLGPLYEPFRHDPLLIPTTGDATPDWDLDHFRRLLDLARPGQAIVLMFHGVPDEAHPWVHTPVTQFERYLEELKTRGFSGIAMRDLARYAHPAAPPEDPVARLRFPE